MSRSFTVEEANRMLPLVRRIVADIVRDYALWQDAVQEFELATLKSRADAPDPRAESLAAEVQRLASDIDGCIRELSDLGIECKSYQDGLIDFPCEYEGREIYLCWRLGEPAVEHWHETEAGFAGRQHVTRDMTDARQILNHGNA